MSTSDDVIDMPVTTEEVRRLRQRVAELEQSVAEQERSHEAARRLAAILEASTDFVATADSNGKVTFVNRAGRRMIGIAPDADLSDMNIVEFHPEWARRHIVEHGHPMMARDSVWVGETALIGADGRDIPVSQLILAHREPDGKLIFLSTIARDISERKQVEAALRESEARYQRIATNVPGMVYQFVLHPDGSAAFPFASEGSRELLGLEPDELRDANRAIELLHPEDRLSFLQTAAETSQTLTPWRWEGRFQLKSGELKWIQGASRPQLLPNGDIVWDGVFLDISDRKRVEEEVRANEERYRSLINGTAQIVWTTSPLGEAVEASPSWCAFTGQSAEESLGMGWLQAIHPDDRQQIGAAWRQAFENKRPYQSEYRLRRHDGDYHEFAVHGVPMLDATGQIREWIGTCIDITEHKRVEEERIRLQEEIIRVQDAALRELSTPLIPISDTVMVMPLIGAMDSGRTQQIMETLLHGISTSRAQVAILDITGVSVVDTQVANALLHAARAVRLLGAQVALTGIRPEVAQTLVGLGVDLRDIMTYSTLQSGIAFAMRQANGAGKGAASFR